MYLLGSTDTLYTINVDSAAASAVGSALNFTGTEIGIDVNPVVDAIRLVSEAAENARINANTGALIANDTALAYDAADVNFGQSPNVTTVAYTSSSPSPLVTTLFAIDTVTNTLVRQGSANATPVSPNTGTLFTVGSLGIDPTDSVGFDIAESRSGKALASIIPSGESAAKLYSIDLGGGNATLIGTIAASAPVLDIAIQRAGAVRLDQSSYTVSEGATTLNVVVERVGGSSNSFSSGTAIPATVLINNNGFSATAGQDFATLNNTVVTFADGEVSKIVQIPIINDSIHEANEGFTVFLSSPTTGLILADSGVASVTILDDDVAPTPTPVLDSTKPVLEVDLVRQIKKSRYLSRGFSFDASCNEACTIEATVTVARGIVNRFNLSSSTLSTNSASLAASDETRVVAKVSSDIRRKLLNRSGSIPATLTVKATDAAGNIDTESKKIVIQDDIRRGR